jgi:hypothetical protein
MNKSKSLHKKYVIFRIKYNPFVQPLNKILHKLIKWNKKNSNKVLMLKTLK